MRYVVFLLAALLVCGCVHETKPTEYSDSVVSLSCPTGWAILTAKNNAGASVICQERVVGGASCSVMWQGSELDLTQIETNPGILPLNGGNVNPMPWEKSTFQGHAALSQRAFKKGSVENEGAEYTNEGLAFNCGGRGYIIRFSAPTKNMLELNQSFESIKESFKCG